MQKAKDGITEFCVKDLKKGEEAGKAQADEINKFLDRDGEDISAPDMCDYLQRAREE